MRRRVHSMFRQAVRFSGDNTSHHQKILKVRAESNDSQAQFELALLLDSDSKEKKDRNPEHPEGNSKTTINDIKVIQTKAKRKKMRIVDFSDMSIQEQVEYWLRRACENEHLDSLVLLGNKLIEKGDRDSVNEAVSLYKKAAEGDIGYHKDACFNLGNIFFNGIGDNIIPVDLKMSLFFFHKAAQANDPGSLYWLGHCYCSGEGGVDQPKLSLHGIEIAGGVDISKAFDYFKSAALNGHPGANYYIATLYRNHIIDGDIISIEESNANFIKYLLLAYDDGDADAAYCLFDLCRGGLYGFPTDEAKCVEYLIESIDRGHADAATCLGAMYYSGCMGLPCDKTKAFELYNLAAERGSKDAWKNLAAMYATGDGVPKSDEMAKHIMKTIFRSSDYN